MPAAWAQIRVGAAIARLGTGALEDAAEEVAPVLRLPAAVLSCASAYGA